MTRGRYLADPSDSGKAHNDVKTRWLNDDQDVLDAMRTFAAYTEVRYRVFRRAVWSV